MTLTTETVSTLTLAYKLTHGVPETRTREDGTPAVTLSLADQVRRLAFSPNSQLLASGGKTIKVWDVSSGELRAALKSQPERLEQLAFAGDDRLVACWPDGRVTVWRLGAVPEIERTLELPGRTIYSAALTGSEHILAAHGAGQELMITNVLNEAEVAHFDLPDTVKTAAFTPDGRQLLALTSLGLMRLWHAAEGVLNVDVLVGFSADMLYLGASADGQLVATRMQDGNLVQVWDTSTGRAHSPALSIVLAHEISFSPDKCLMAVTTTRAHGGIELRDTQTGDVLHTLNGSYPAVFSPDGRLLACGAAATGQNREVALFAAGRAIQSDMRAQRSRPITLDTVAQVGNLAILKGHSLPVRGIAISPDSRWIASGSADKTLRVWDTATGEAVITLRQHGAAVNRVVFSADGRRLVSASGDPGCDADHSVRVFALRDGPISAEETLTFKAHQAAVTSVDLSPDGTFIASADSSGRLLLWDSRSGVVQQDIAHAAPVNDVDFSPDGRLVAVAVGGETDRGLWDADNSVRLWDALSGELYAVLKRHRDWVMRALFSPDGRIAAAIDHRKRLYGWEIGSQRIVLDQVNSTAIALTSSDDLAAVARGAVIQLINPQTGETLAELAGHTAPINQMVFNHDNTLLASACDDGTVRLWGVPQPGQSVIVSAIETPAKPASPAAPAVFTLRLIELRCLRGQERDGDEVYLKVDGRTVWDVQKFGRTMGSRVSRHTCTHFNFRDCTYDMPQGRATAEGYHPNNFILSSWQEPVTMQLWEADSFLRGGDDLFGEIMVDASAGQWDEIECDFDRGGAHYRLVFAVMVADS